MVGRGGAWAQQKQKQQQQAWQQGTRRLFDDDGPRMLNAAVLNGSNLVPHALCEGPDFTARRNVDVLLWNTQDT